LLPNAGSTWPVKEAEDDIDAVARAAAGIDMADADADDGMGADAATAVARPGTAAADTLPVPTGPVATRIAGKGANGSVDTCASVVAAAAAVG
jgi:hypothetical protein